MQLKAYSIRDTKVNTYNVPFFAKTEEDAVRTLTRLKMDPNSNVSLFPEDFDLYYVGEYSDQTGTIDASETPIHVIKAVNIQLNN